MLSVSESLDLFLKSHADHPFNGDLMQRIAEHGIDLELQINVAPDGGELVDGTVSTYTDGPNRWFSFRIPRDSYSTPHFDDFKLQYPLDKHIDSLGCTGWHWKDRKSLWVAYDFDSITGHAEGVGISDLELTRVREAVSGLDYVEVRRSTSGAGLHLYVFLPDGVRTENHTEHAAIARCVLSQISAEVGHNLAQHVDACGTNTWVWARRATRENQGFECLKKAVKPFDGDLSGWRTHLDVVNRSRPRVSVGIQSSREESLFESLTQAHRRIPLDEQHIAVRDKLAEMGCSVWVNDHHLLQTHTALLAQIKDQELLPIKGVFQTNSPGSNTNSPNCFAYPVDNGAWKVFRFGLGTSEASTWEQDGKGWTSCYYNRSADLNCAAVANEGKRVERGGFEFPTLQEAVEMIKRDLANDPNFFVDCPPSISNRECLIREGRDGDIVLQVIKERSDQPLKHWNSADRKGYWTQIVSLRREETDTVSNIDYDSLVRCLQTPNDQPAGWAAFLKDGKWSRKKASSIKTILQGIGLSKGDSEIVMGQSELIPWTIVSQPFRPEYPGDRCWNLRAPQLAIQPAPPNDSLQSKHPHWDMILDHVGLSINSALRKESWANEAGVITGRQYLQAWYANLIRNPYAPLPYLFLFGPENSGKSIYHEAFSLLVTGGVVKADKALTSDFNGELEGCILAVVEEKDIARVKGSHEKIKDAVTSPTLSVRRMRTDTYQVKNTTHWVQCANDISACPVFPGDTRITVLFVPEIEVEIPKQRLLSLLQEEAPHFLSTLLNMKLPNPTGRLRLPVVVTEEKRALQNSNKTILEQFIDEYCELNHGHQEAYKDFKTAFWAAFSEAERQYPVQRLSRELKMQPGIKIISATNNRRVISGLKLKDNK